MHVTFKIVVFKMNGQEVRIASKLNEVGAAPFKMTQCEHIGKKGTQCETMGTSDEVRSCDIDGQTKCLKCSKYFGIIQCKNCETPMERGNAKKINLDEFEADELIPKDDRGKDSVSVCERCYTGFCMKHHIQCAGYRCNRNRLLNLDNPIANILRPDKMTYNKHNDNPYCKNCSGQKMTCRVKGCDKEDSVINGAYSGGCFQCSSCLEILSNGVDLQDGEVFPSYQIISDQNQGDRKRKAKLQNSQVSHNPVVVPNRKGQSIAGPRYELEALQCDIDAAKNYVPSEQKKKNPLKKVVNGGKTRTLEQKKQQKKEAKIREQTGQVKDSLFNEYTGEGEEVVSDDKLEQKKRNEGTIGRTKRGGGANNRKLVKHERHVQKIHIDFACVDSIIWSLANNKISHGIWFTRCLHVRFAFYNDVPQHITDQTRTIKSLKKKHVSAVNRINEMIKVVEEMLVKQNPKFNMMLKEMIVLEEEIQIFDDLIDEAENDLDLMKIRLNQIKSVEKEHIRDFIYDMIAGHFDEEGMEKKHILEKHTVIFSVISEENREYMIIKMESRYRAAADKEMAEEKAAQDEEMRIAEETNVYVKFMEIGDVCTTNYMKWLWKVTSEDTVEQMMDVTEELNAMAEKMFCMKNPKINTIFEEMVEGEEAVQKVSDFIAETEESNVKIVKKECKLAPNFITNMTNKIGLANLKETLFENNVVEEETTTMETCSGFGIGATVKLDFSIRATNSRRSLRPQRKVRNANV